jgi:hypothetical protein
VGGSLKGLGSWADKILKAKEHTRERRIKRQKSVKYSRYLPT